MVYGDGIEKGEKLNNCSSESWLCWFINGGIRKYVSLYNKIVLSNKSVLFSYKLNDSSFFS